MVCLLSALVIAGALICVFVKDLRCGQGMEFWGETVRLWKKKQAETGIVETRIMTPRFESWILLQDNQHMRRESESSLDAGIL